MNKRKKIRTAVVSRLGNISSEGNPVPVFNNRYMPIKNRPGINVQTPDETSEKSADEQANKRDQELNIEVFAEGVEDHEIENSGELSVYDKLENMIEQIETEFNKSWEALGGVIHRLNYTGSELEVYGDGETMIAIRSLRYNANYNEELE